MDKETSEIAKLTERISKDPKSKLFVPLAEEYKKTGEIEMAIYVLTEGLKNNPGYVTARSVLGKLLLEKGDLEASQKEFEEVVKAIPDNLMAQRKLGELYAFQNRPDEAIKHLKIVFSANSRDTELASLISDLEAGRDVSQRIHLPKTKPSPEKSASQGTQTAPSAQAPTKVISPRAAAAPAAPVLQKTEVKAKQVPEKGPAAPLVPKAPERTPPPVTASLAVPPAEEAEEPEDIMALEPLESVDTGPENAAPDADLFAEQDSGTATAPLEEPFAVMAPAEIEEQGPEASDQEPFAEMAPVKIEEPGPEISAGAESFFAETTPGGQPEEQDAMPDLADMADESDIIGAEVVEEALEAVTATEVRGEGAEKSDDFTTDTLAELYIAQGFFEKAIDIYERMLADRPTSRGLKNKLEKVREMAAEAGPAAPSAVAEETAKSPVPEPDIFAEILEKGTPEVSKRGPDAASAPSFDVFEESPARAGAEAKPLYTDFEPREYVPPKDEFEPAAQKVEAVPAASMPSKATRRETIDRLETWLKNIKKEK